MEMDMKAMGVHSLKKISSDRLSRKEVRQQIDWRSKVSPILFKCVPYAAKRRKPYNIFLFHAIEV
jgi:hypothetical protein